MTSMTASLDLPATPLRRRGSLVLWRTAGTVLAFMPVAMAVAHRSSPLVLTLTALLAAAAIAVERGWAGALRAMRRAVITPLGAAVLAFCGWSAVSLLWSEFRGASLHALLEFWFPVAVAFFLAVALPHRLPRWGVWVLVGGLAMACAVILAELHTGLWARQVLGMRAATFIFNRPVLTILVGLVPVLAALRAHGPWGWASGIALAALVLVTIATSESGAAAFGAAVVAAVTAMAFFAPRLVLRGAAIAVVLALAAAPVAGAFADRLIPPGVHERLADSHSRDRVDIWLSFGAAIAARPWLGTGFGTSPRLGASTVAAEVPAERRELLAVGHPHNVAVQVWTELGLVGAVLAGLVLLLTLRAVAALPLRDLAPILGLMAGAATVSLVGHGAWQGWWPAALGAAVVWFRFAHHHDRETSR